MKLKISSAKYRPLSSGHNGLNIYSCNSFLLVQRKNTVSNGDHTVFFSVSATREEHTDAMPIFDAQQMPVAWLTVSWSGRRSCLGWTLAVLVLMAGETRL